jgi:putative ABC transport system substrate-binding protein
VAAQLGRRLPRVALIGDFSPVAVGLGPDPADAYVRAFVHGLRDLGLVDGRDVIIERRTTEGRVDRAPALMQEAIKLGVDVIVTSGGPAVWAAHRATDHIAIVGLVDDVLDMGILDSLARPGHNVTGIGECDPALHGKRLQMMREVAPSISHIAVICYSQGPNDRGQWRRDLHAAGRTMGLQTLWLEVNTIEQFDAAFAKIVRERVDAIYATATHVNDVNAGLIADFALKRRLPSFGFAENGMLFSYWADYKEVNRRAAVIVKKILDGAKPGELPFEQPTRFELVINLKTARAIGVSIPQSLLLRATQVIG